jgi:cobyrinic acid a,c-diamide synthase
VTARLVIAGVSSGVGKTSLTAAIARALTARGLRVAMFKVGPDYLDPTYHARASRGTAHNLDGWMMGEAGVRESFARASTGADVALIEGVMGLFDGLTPTGEEASTAQLAKWLDAPVILVCDAAGMARSVAALVHGYASFDPAVGVRGVVCNRVGSARHLALLREALGERVPYVAGMPKWPGLSFPERHLGLRTAEEAAVSEETFDAWGRLAEEWLDLDALLALARSAPPLSSSPVVETRSQVRCRIGIARDEAFHFYYAYNLALLEQLGAELVPFSPVHDRALPDVDGLYLGGGYPEVHAAALAANTPMREAVRAFASSRPVYAECGGLMYLASSIRTRDGVVHPMVGVVPGQAVMADRLQAIGYVEVETRADSILGPVGTRYRGHQFRYSDLALSGEIEPVLTLMRPRDGACQSEGYCHNRTLATYVHAHWASNPAVAQAFVTVCMPGARR